MSTNPLQQRLDECLQRLDTPPPLQVEGRLTRMVGLALEAEGCRSAIGGRCKISTHDGDFIEAEVVGFAGDKLFLMPTSDSHGVGPGARVIPLSTVAMVPVGRGLLGRIIDGAGKPLDGQGPLDVEAHIPLQGKPINPLGRHPIDQPIDVGIKAINSLLTVGRGQRMGLFAGSGVGKSVLLGMMTRFTDADVIVVGLIGERGREVKEFIEQSLGPEGLRRSVVVAAPADASPLMRLHGTMVATRIAEYFRDQGLNVLLLIDSLTRLAQAQRELSLAIGEPPATKGYPPSVFSKLPQIVERAGNADQGGGSITAFYTVLAEGDDQQDPIADAARAILDGHVVLSRQLAESGHYPAIDIEASISRAMAQITPPEHQQDALLCKRILSAYWRNRDLINVGAYSAGSDVEVDLGIKYFPQISTFLRQGMQEKASLADSVKGAAQIAQQLRQSANVSVPSG